MKKVTISLDEEVARWARIRAAKWNTSLPRLMVKLLKEKMLEEQNYQTAMERYLSRSPRFLKNPELDTSAERSCTSAKVLPGLSAYAEKIISF
jgi:hypothetical protein